jgi:hypothetical protein
MVAKLPRQNYKLDAGVIGVTVPELSMDCDMVPDLGNGTSPDGLRR